MPEEQTHSGADLVGARRKLAAWAVLVVLVWIALGMYSDFRGALRTTKSNNPAASSDATASAEATGVLPSGEGSASSGVAEPGVVVLAEGLNLREKPMTSSKVIKKLKKGTSLELLETAGGWYRVRDAAGVEGWVAAGGNYTQLVEAR